MLPSANSKRCRIALLVLPCLLPFVVLGLLICEVNFDFIVSSLIAQELILTKDSKSYEIITGANDGRIEFYIFNVTNIEDWHTYMDKPILQTVGPYVYRKVITKGNFSFSEEGNQTYFHFTERTRYFFERNESVGDHKEDIVYMPSFYKIILDYVIHYNHTSALAGWIPFSYFQTEFYYAKKVEEILWGFEDIWLSPMAVLGIVEDSIGGLFKNTNNSVNGPFKINTGFGNLSQLGLLKEYRNEPSLNIWGSDYANMLNGSVEALTPPNIKLGDVRYMFGSSVCRSIALKAKNFVPATKYHDLKLINLEPDKSLFQSAYENLDNEAFHIKSYSEGRYPPSGLWSMNPCLNLGVKGVAPIFLSLPYFYLGDQALKDAVTFEGPVEEDLISHFATEPKTGIVVEGNLQYQINVYIPEALFEGSGNIYFPLVYVKDKVSAGQEAVEDLYNAVYRMPSTMRLVLRCLMALGVALILVLGIAVCILSCRDSTKWESMRYVDDKWDEKMWDTSESFTSYLE